MNKYELKKLIEQEGDEYSFKWKRFFCKILRSSATLNLNGYVGVNNSSCLYKKDYGDNLIRTINVHGGITFSNFMESRQTTLLWWFGFDTAHWEDLIPIIIIKDITHTHHSWNQNQSSKSYRDMNYVKNECIKLAKQLDKLEKGSFKTIFLIERR